MTTPADSTRRSRAWRAPRGTPGRVCKSLNEMASAAAGEFARVLCVYKISGVKWVDAFAQIFEQEPCCSAEMHQPAETMPADAELRINKSLRSSNIDMSVDR